MGNPFSQEILLVSNKSPQIEYVFHTRVKIWKNMKFIYLVSGFFSFRLMFQHIVLALGFLIQNDFRLEGLGKGGHIQGP